MTKNMNQEENNNFKKADPNTWTAYGDPLKNNSSHTTNPEYVNVDSPIIENTGKDGNIVKRD